MPEAPRHHVVLPSLLKLGFRLALALAAVGVAAFSLATDDSAGDIAIAIGVGLTGLGATAYYVWRIATRRREALIVDAAGVEWGGVRMTHRQAGPFAVAEQIGFGPEAIPYYRVIATGRKAVLPGHYPHDVGDLAEWLERCRKDLAPPPRGLVRGKLARAGRHWPIVLGVLGACALVPAALVAAVGDDSLLVVLAIVGLPVAGGALLGSRLYSMSLALISAAAMTIAGLALA